MLKNLKINEETHTALKDYCCEHGMKVGRLAEIIITSFLNEEGSNNEVRHLRNKK